MNFIFTVIIPTFQRPGFTKIALDSVLNQTCISYEIIVCDDSLDSSIKNLINEVNYKNIKYFQNNKQLGVALNIKKAITKAEGKFIAILNDDDFWHPEWLESVLKRLEIDDNSDLIFCDHWLVDANGNKLHTDTDLNTLHYKRNILKDTIPFSQACELYLNNSIPIAMGSVFRKSILDLNDFPNEIDGAYDRWIMMQILSNTKNYIYYIPKRLTYYRVHSLSLTATQRTNNLIGLEFVLNRSIDRFKQHDCNKKIIYSYRGSLRTLIKAFILDRQIVKAFSILKKYILSFSK